jgi:hypothetical protein
MTTSPDGVPRFPSEDALRAALEARLPGLAQESGEGNPALHPMVDACLRFRGDWFAALIAPRWLRLFLLPGGGELWGDIPQGQQRYLTLGGHDWRFVAARDELLGDFQWCDLLGGAGLPRTMDEAQVVVRDALLALGLVAPPGPVASTAANGGGVPGGRRGFLRALAGRR